MKCTHWKIAALILLTCLPGLYRRASAQALSTDSLYRIASSRVPYSQKLEATLMLAGALRSISNDTSLIDTVYQMLTKLEHIAKAINDQRNLAIIRLDKAYHFQSTLQLDSQIAYGTLAEVYFRNAGDTLLLNACYDNLWSAHRRLNHFSAAIGYLFKRKELQEQQKDMNGLIGSYYNLGIMYLSKDMEPEKARDAFRKPEQYGGFIPATTYNALSETYILLGQPDSALMCLEKSRSTATSAYLYGPPYYYRALARYYEFTGRDDSALFCFNKAIQLFEEVKHFHNQSKCYTHIGNILVKRKEYAKAETAYRKAEKIASRYLYFELPGIYLALSQLYEKQGREHDAYLALQHYCIAEDSIKRTETTDILFADNLKHEYNLREYEVKNNQLKKEYEKQALIRKQRQTVYVAIAVIGFLLVIAFLIYRSRKIVFREKQRSDTLLLNILPVEVAEELKEKGHAGAKHFDLVTVMFTDFKGFTHISEKLSPEELVAEIDTCFRAFDHIISRHNIEKIKTIGDSYMCAGGLPAPNETHAEDVVKAALEIRDFMIYHAEQRHKENKPGFEIRIGIHTGPVVAGIVGVKKFAYDIWGDAVNTASRMESSGEPGKINISGATWNLVKDKFECTSRGKIAAKNKGEIEMYFVNRSFSER